MQNQEKQQGKTATVKNREVWQRKVFDECAEENEPFKFYRKYIKR